MSEGLYEAHWGDQEPESIRGIEAESGVALAHRLVIIGPAIEGLHEISASGVALAHRLVIIGPAIEGLHGISASGVALAHRLVIICDFGVGFGRSE